MMRRSAVSPALSSSHAARRGGTITLPSPVRRRAIRSPQLLTTAPCPSALDAFSRHAAEPVRGVCDDDTAASARLCRLRRRSLFRYRSWPLATVAAHRRDVNDLGDFVVECVHATPSVFEELTRPAITPVAAYGEGASRNIRDTGRQLHTARIDPAPGCAAALQLRGVLRAAPRRRGGSCLCSGHRRALAHRRSRRAGCRNWSSVPSKVGLERGVPLACVVVLDPALVDAWASSTMAT